MSKKDTKKMLAENKIRWARIAGVVDDREARERMHRLNEAKQAFPGNEVELEEDMEMDPDGGYHYLDEEDDEMMPGEEPMDDMGGDEELADLEDEPMGDMDMDMADDTMGGGGEELAARLITAISNAIEQELDVDTEVEIEPEMGMDDMDDMGGAEAEMDYDVNDMGDVNGDEALEDAEELAEDLKNSINPSGGKVDDVDGSYYDHDMKDEKSHLKNSINEGLVEELSEAVMRKIARYIKK